MFSSESAGGKQCCSSGALTGAMLAIRSLCRTAGRCFSTEAAETYDVVVVGGGMVGMSLAAALGMLSTPSKSTYNGIFTLQ